MIGAASVWADLSPTWQTVFTDAWESWRAGNYGVGAILVDPGTGEVVATGRNRVAEHPIEPGVLAGNMLAHAEMNAFASMPSFNATGLHLYTTLEPCLMCAAAAMQLKVEAVHFAAVDEFYVGLADLWEAHPLTADRRPERHGPFDGDRERLASFARLLPLSFTLRRFPDRSASLIAREQSPALSALAEEIVGELDADDASPERPLSRWWDRLDGSVHHG